jgi:hypothetical protein
VGEVRYGWRQLAQDFRKTLGRRKLTITDAILMLNANDCYSCNFIHVFAWVVLGLNTPNLVYFVATNVRESSRAARRSAVPTRWAKTQFRSSVMQAGNHV